MRVLFYTILICFTGSSLAQQETPTVNNNSINSVPATNNSNMNSPTLKLGEVNEESLQVDSVSKSPAPVSVESIQSKGVRQKSANKKIKAAGRIQKSPAAEDEAPAMKDEIHTNDAIMNREVEEYSSNSQSTKALEMQSVSTSFSSTYTTSDMQRTSRSPSVQQQVQMDQAVDYFQTNAPGSFESHYFKYVAGNYNTELISDLKAAEQIRPDNSDVHVQLAGYYMIEQDVDSALVYVEKLRNAQRLADNIVSYSGDILRSVPEEGTLITHGFDDGYGSYYAQNSQEIRQDVTLVSLDFLQSEAYQNNLKEKGFELPKSTIVDVDYLAEFCALNVDKNLSISLTTPKEYFQAIQDKLYVVGLVFEYHPESYDNFTRNDFLWNNSMEKQVIVNPMDEKGKQLSANYLPMLLHLRKVYRATGEEDKLKKVDEVCDEIGVQSRRYEQVQKVKSSY